VPASAGSNGGFCCYLGTMRLRLVTSLALGGVVGLAAACGFGVDLDNLFSDSGSLDGSADGALDGSPEGSIPKVQVTHLAVGENFTCGRRADGSVMCWGLNGQYGRLGDGLQPSSSVPVLVKELSDAVDVSAGSAHACAARASGAVSCWGNNDARQLGDGSTAASRTPRTVLGLDNAARVSAGGGFACALRKDGSVWCWGENGEGQLGDGTKTTRSQAAAVTGLGGVTQLATARSTACALTAAGDVLCWGANGSGQAGVAPSPTVDAPTKIASLTGVTAIAASGVGGNFCAVLGAGELRCWGYGDNGELGNAKTTSSEIPVTVVGVSDAAGVAVGDGFACGWTKSGAVSCWGANAWRQLGVGDSAPPDRTSTPVPASGISGVQLLAAGRTHTCALTGDGQRISCWGANVHGALGRGTRVYSDVPVKATTPGVTKALAVGYRHACAVDTQGALACWGSNDQRALSVGTFPATATPTVIPEIVGATQATAGDDHTCALLGSGQIQCWGNGSYGALGNGATPYTQRTPVVYAAPSAGAELGAGTDFTCARLGTGEVVCAGADSYGRLGTPKATAPALTPVNVETAAAPDPDAGADAGPTTVPLGGVKRISVGFGHSCAVYGPDTVACWGNGAEGEVGRVITTQNTAFDVTLPGPAVDVATGADHTCAVLQDGTVRCWGANDRGQVSGSAASGPALRTPALAGKTAKAVAAGARHSCALLTDGTVTCWGEGSYGELGNGLRVDAPTPTPSAVRDLTKVTAIAAGEQYTCALVEDGSVWCWGTNSTGQLGDGTVMTTGVPAAVAGY
jgi:alpha-tubulin suppressor-like RCC1 family protein